MLRTILLFSLLSIPFFEADARSPGKSSCEVKQSQIKKSVREMRKLFPKMKSYPKKATRCWCMLECTVGTLEFEPVRHFVAKTNVEFEVRFHGTVDLVPNEQIERLPNDNIYELKKIATQIREIPALQVYHEEKLLCRVESKHGNFNFVCAPAKSKENQGLIVKGQLVAGEIESRVGQNEVKEVIPILNAQED